MNRKGQSALEFLTTYAWAFIVIIIVIAAIAYFGVLRPTKILPDRCNFNFGFGCEAYTATSGAAGSMTLLLKNGLGQVITLTSASASVEGPTTLTCSSTPTLPINWVTGNATTFAWTGCDFSAVGFTRGDKGKVLVTLNYYDAKAGATFTHIADGEVFTAFN